MRKAIPLLLVLAMATPLLGLGAGMRLRAGIGLADVGYGVQLASFEVHGDFPFLDPFALRLSVSFLPPLLPGEGTATVWGAGPILSLGEKFLFQLGGSGGVLWEGAPLVEPHLALDGLAGVAYRFGDIGLYFQGRIILAYKNAPRGTHSYAYQLWSFGMSLEL